jgi:iron complex outermembrane recepter protein
VYIGPLFGDGGCPLTRTEDDAFTYLVTPRLRLNDNFMVYARAASGFRAGGPNVFNPNPAVPRHYDPDDTHTYEIGVKGSSPSHVVSFDASVFHIDFKDLQINLLDPAFYLVNTSNGSRAKSDGVEMSLAIRPTNSLSITTWAAYTDAALTENMPPNSSVVGVEGNRLPYSARVTGSLSMTQELPLRGSLSGFVGAALAYVGDRMGTFVSTPDRERYPSYTRIDLNAGVRFDEWSANLYANNIANKRGVLGGGAGTYPPFAFTYIQPRTVGVTITKLF